MPQIANTYANPDVSIGNSLEALGNSIWGPQAAAAEYAKQKATDARRVNVSKDALAAAIRANGGNFDAANPDVAASVVGLDDPRKFFQGVQGLVANRYGATDRRTSNAQIGAGESIGATQVGLGQTLANARGIAQMQIEKTLAAQRAKDEGTFVNVMDPNSPGGYRTVTVSQARTLPSMQQVLGNSDATGALKMAGFPAGYKDYNEMQQKAADVNLPVDKVQNYIAPGPGGKPLTGRTIDGKTDMTTNRPLPAQAQIASSGNPGGTNVFASPLSPDTKMQSDLRGRIAANQQLEDLTSHAMGLVSKDPTIVGAPGVVQKFGQNAMTAARDVANYFGQGKSLEQSLANVQQEAASRLGPNAIRLLPELYKPQINELDAIHAIITYKAAESLFGQSGRDLSDRDVAGARAMVGDPSSLFESSRSFMEKMSTINQMAKAQRINAESMISSNDVTRGTPVVAPMPGPAAPAAPAVSNGGADPLAQARDAIARGADPAKVMQRLQQLVTTPAGQ